MNFRLKQPVSILRSTLIILVIFFQTGFAAGVDLDKEFRQIVDANFWLQLRAAENCERAVFVENCTGDKMILYARYQKGNYIVRGHINRKHEETIRPALDKLESGIFAPLKSDNQPLYNHGYCHTGKVEKARMLYVPHIINKAESDAFISDLGYLEFVWPKAPLDEFENALARLQLRIMKTVRLNRFYLFRDDYFGPVSEFCHDVSEDIVFAPIHKITFNKWLGEREKKAHKDKKLFSEILADDRYLFSQDMRLKLGMVPPFVKLDFNRIEETDIGSGQNHLVFLTIGPGINYFDAPWMSRIQNMPGPRLIFHRKIVDLCQIQIYPSYSIDPPESGDKRLAAINMLQNSNFSGQSQRKAKWADGQTRTVLYREIEKELCSYGLTNDSTLLKKGFSLMGHNFSGNIVNNEVRLWQFAPTRDMLVAAIVPSDLAKSYYQEYESKLKNSSPHWFYNCGIDYRHLFLEAPENSDKGFRSAWLHHLLRQSHPYLSRLMTLSLNMKAYNAYNLIADIVSQRVKKEGRTFFLTREFHQFRQLDRERIRAWLAYLEAYRNGNEKIARSLLDQYHKIYTSYAKRFFD